MIVSFENCKKGRITFKRVTSLSYVPKNNRYYLKYRDFMFNTHAEILDANEYQLECVYDD